MHRVLLDANVLISAFSSYRRSNSVTVRILRSLLTADSNSVIVISEHVHAEVARALASPYFRDRMTGEERLWVYSRLRADPFTYLTPEPVEQVASHGEDDIVLGTALAGEVDYLVTSDRALLRLGEFRGIAIVSPPQFLAIIESSANP